MLQTKKISKGLTFKSWTAVVRGAVVYGIEKAAHPMRTMMETCPRSYGVMLNRAYSGLRHNRKDRYTDPATNRVMAQGQMTWLIKKGDLVLSDNPKEAEQEFSFKFKRDDNRVFNFSVYEYSDDDIPDRYETAQDGKFALLLSTNVDLIMVF
jgi:hypothetical protein